MPADLPPVTLDVAAVASHSGESFDRFLHRAGLTLDAYTARTGFEGCGQLWQSADGSAWTVHLVSSGAHIGCRIPANGPGEGWVPMHRSMHSHAPRGWRFRYNAADRTFARGRSLYQGWQSARGQGFSEADLRQGPGYLVQDGQLWTHDDRGSVQAIPLQAGLP